MIKRSQLQIYSALAACSLILLGCSANSNFRPLGKSKGNAYVQKQELGQTQTEIVEEQIKPVDHSSHIISNSDFKIETYDKDTWDHEKYLALSSKDRKALSYNPSGIEECGANQDWERATLNQNKANISFEEAHKLAKSGDVHAFSKLADLYMLGEGTPRNPLQSLYWHTKAANRGIVASQIALGNVYRDGHGVAKSVQRARDWYKKAADQNSVHAMLLLGESYEGWVLAEVDLDKAEYWYLRAACLGSQGAITKLSRLHGDLANYNNEDDLVNDDENSCNLNAKKSKNNTKNKRVDKLSLMKYQTKDDKDYQNEAKMINFYAQAANNSAEAAYQLGMMYYNGELLQKDANAALYWLSKSAHMGYAPAQYQLGFMYNHALGVSRNLAQAQHWYYKAIDKKFPAAAARMGDLYHNGDGVPRYSETAAKWYEIGAEQGDNYSQYMISIMYEFGRGVIQDICKSTSWYNVAETNKLNFIALTQVANNWEFGKGLPKNLDQATRWYKRAAKLNYVPAKTALGDIYSDKNNEFVNATDAHKWYLSAADQGSAYAEYCLGIANLLGTAENSNPRSAAQWLKQAAQKGHRPAQFELGLQYFTGHGVKRNDVRAYGWWSIALAEHNELTPENLSELINRMEPDIKNKALALSGRYKSRYGYSVTEKIYEKKEEQNKQHK